MCSFTPNLDNPTFIVVSKQLLPLTRSLPFNVLSHRRKNTELVKIKRQVGGSYRFFAPRIHGIKSPHPLDLTVARTTNDQTNFSGLR